MAKDKPPAGGLKPQAVVRYVRDGGAACPFCGGSDGLQHRNPVAKGTEWIYPIELCVECLNCGKRWAELYRLASIEERT